MNADSDRIIELFSQARALVTAEERARFLEEACRDDPEARAQIESLLRVEARARDYLKPGVCPPGQLTEQPGDRIGRYKLLQPVGEGGCGVVYMAEQEEPVRRRVALKVIKLGMDTKQVIARFEAERQALALMDHPNIAKVLDAGATETGRPYFVMELVRGIKITEFCDQNRLSTVERLELFIQVCQAVQHAHQKGVIHRDLKPSNVLVTSLDGIPIPKVIDFGIAKATAGRLTDRTLFTAFEQFIGTPAYMSPEQAELTAVDVDTRSDIYSLGVLLYELLTGTTPFDQKELLAAGFDAMRRIIREQTPVKPSTRLTQTAKSGIRDSKSEKDSAVRTLPSAIPSDLDWITMKCLEKDRSRRYETANSLAADLQRHLNCEPVVARPPSKLYEFQKTVRRHKFGFAAAAALILVLAAGVVVSTRAAVRANLAEREAQSARAKAEANERKAETEAARSAQVAQFMKEMLKGVGPSVALSEDTKLLKRILDDAAKRIARELTNQPAVYVELRNTLAEVYGDLGRYEQMEHMARENLEFCRAKFGEENLHVAAAHSVLAEALKERCRFDEAEATARKALAMKESSAPSDTEEILVSISALGLVLWERGKLDEAEAWFRKGLEMTRAKSARDDTQAATWMNNLGNVLVARGKLAEALTNYTDALALEQKTLPPGHPRTADIRRNLALVLSELGNAKEAEMLLKEALETNQRVSGEHRDTARSMTALAGFFAEEGRLIEAEMLLREALEMQIKLLGTTNLDVCTSIDNLAGVLKEQGRLAEARKLYRQALDIANAVLGDEHAWVATGIFNLATIDLDLGRPAAAEKLFREALGLREKLLGEHLSVAKSLDGLGVALVSQKKLGEAETVYQRGLAIREKLLTPEHPDVADSLESLADLRWRQGNPVEAERLFQNALDSRRKSQGDHWRTAETLCNLGKLLQQQNQSAQAEELLLEALEVNLRVTSGRSMALGDPLNLLAAMFERQGRHEDMEKLYRDALAVVRKVSGGDPAWETRDLGLVLHHLAELLYRRNAVTEARPLAEEAVDLYQRHPDWPLREHSHALAVLKLIWLSIGEVSQIEALERGELQVLHRKLHADPEDASTMNSLAWRLATHRSPRLRDGQEAFNLAEKAVALTERGNSGMLDTLAAAHAEVGDFERAIHTQKEALAGAKNQSARENYALRLKMYESGRPWRDVSPLPPLAGELLNLGKFAAAEPLARENLTLCEAQMPEHWRAFEARALLGAALLGQKKYRDAELLLLSGCEGLKQREAQIPTNGKLTLKAALQGLVRLYEETNRPDAAAKWNEKLAEFDSSVE